MSGIPPQLRLHRVWWTRKSSSIPVTMFTTATLDRLDMLDTQCRNYRGGPHVAAVYLPLVQAANKSGLTNENEQAVRTAEEKLQELFYRMEATTEACHMHILFLYEVTSDSALAYLTPINALRNAALLASQTQLVMMIDVDLCVSNTLVQFVSESKYIDQLVRMSSNSFWVLPAWDVNKQLPQEQINEVAASAASGTKMQLVKLWLNGSLNWFGQHYFQLGHSPTNYTRWLMSRRSYVIDYSIGYEPWGLVSRDRMAIVPYDARFRGCYNDKIAHVVSLHHSGLLFKALPNAWVVHRPHALNPAAAIAKAVVGSSLSQHGVGALQEVVHMHGKNASKFEHHKDWSHVLLDDSVVRMLANRYRPFPGKQYTYCRRTLPWFATKTTQATVATTTTTQRRDEEVT
ncbi:hypothetical protein VOLCADRAFT_127353 [Volvox carteri f. nagariensis]|uniref:InvC n=1 Tax=Volvox carteri f. nagariensis TaxID=3068 RepID=B6ZKF6_VOLCA|nr:uncharacterized protein VOLCADRAFT_127353 [Volvox carteri f. nagariensis]EFJ52772.1 hypothetical protein VOLCADRAFT_127353 [Volvox carteri f. nagariensis]BAH03159.1 InvC [Volvox carteri f. nagariensis]|eukprot:XP_002945777.1 hypothetical protein VOLCADRAFT_127353 [Volvox carteri f. nagariensis]